MTSIKNILPKLKGVKKSGDQKWKALCPCHDDQNQSLSITDDNGKVLLFCHAGCKFEDIIKKLQITPSSKKHKKLLTIGFKIQPFIGLIRFMSLLLKISHFNNHFTQPYLHFF